MIVLGLLLILAAVGATVFAVMAPSATNETIVVTALGVKVSASPLAMFIAGAVSVALLGLSYVLISRGTRRKARSRKELRQLRKEQAAAGTGPSAEGGHRSSRRDRHQADSQTSTTTEDSSDTGTSTDIGSNTEAEASPGSGTSLPSDRHQGSEPPSAT
jgi:ABC-type transport system involved in cytochrome bd biosynthesis fused ATPase/permease subunit